MPGCPCPGRWPCSAALPPPDAQRISSLDGLRGFLADPGNLPVFGKLAQGKRSADALSVAGYDAAADAVLAPGGKAIDVSRIWQHLRRHHRGGGYLFQAHLCQHPDIVKAVGPVIGTLRVITLFLDGKVHLHQAFWKIPVGGTFADNLWRGNLAAPVEVESGTMGAAIADLTGRRLVHTEHPVTGAALEGRLLPDWGALTTAVRQAAGLLHVLPLIGWDVALGVDGPVIVEANASPSLELPQYLTGQGAFAGEAGERLRRLVAETDGIRRARKTGKRRRRLGLLRDRL